MWSCLCPLSLKDWVVLFGQRHAREVLGRIVVTHESRLTVTSEFQSSVFLLCHVSLML